MIKTTTPNQHHVRDIQPSDFPRYGTRAMQIRFLLQYAILAPSGHNTQPWKFQICENKLNVYADVGKKLGVVDPYNRELIISCGAAIGVFQHAARYFGCTAHVVSLNPSPDTNLFEEPLATIELLAGQEATEHEVSLFNAITTRFTQRADFFDLAPDIDDIETCKVIANTHDTSLFLGCDEEIKQALASLVSNGDRAQYSNPDFRSELGLWLKSKQIGNQDGISMDSFGLPDMLTPLGGLLIRTVDLGSRIGASHEKQINKPSTVIGILSSHNDDVEDLLKTGMSLSHILLHLTSKGLSVSFYNEPIEIKALRVELSKLTENNGVPQMLFRIGYGPQAHASSRRSVEDCLIP